jgi:uncharacterized membrane protein
MYLALKLLHIVAAIAFLGSITLGLFWQALAARKRDARALAWTLEAIARGDNVFTKPGAALLLLTGLAIVHVGHLSIVNSGWILWSLVLLIAAGVAYGALAAPVRRQILELALRDAQAGTWSDAEHGALARRFRARVAIAWAMPVIGLTLMVLKPF